MGLEDNARQLRITTVRELMQRFGVSRQAATVRVQELHLCEREMELFDL
ncbi:MAG TPA: hypothetical protein VNN76_04155 [Bacteroidota bacterium]|nr:hypothetical protein [Bacteroidota bacterium]